jgi:indole-3-glycerol phosphate synthase
LDDDKIKEFYKISHSLGMDVICEVHDNDELKRALNLDVNCIGINNRNLKTLEIDTDTFIKLQKKIPKGKIKICESGIHSNIQLAKFTNQGADAFLIGESLMSAKNIFEKTRNLIKK